MRSRRPRGRSRNIIDRLNLTAEDIEQIKIVGHLRAKYPQIKFTISPMRQFSFLQGYKSKLLGYNKGTLDLMIFAVRGSFAGLHLEVKTQKTSISNKGTLSKDQKEWMCVLNKEGYCTAVCYGYNEGIDIIDNYFSL